MSSDTSKTVLHARVVSQFDGRGMIRAFQDVTADDPSAVFERLTIDPFLVAGADITVTVPVCPGENCERLATDAVNAICPCGHSWADAARAAYEARRAEVLARDAERAAAEKTPDAPPG